MRIVGYIEHPAYKITIMHMNHRYALKFENAGIEQTYKIRESEYITGPDAIKKLIDSKILDQISKQFETMETIRLELLSASIEDEEDFEEII